MRPTISRLQRGEDRHVRERDRLEANDSANGGERFKQRSRDLSLSLLRARQARELETSGVRKDRTNRFGHRIARLRGANGVPSQGKFLLPAQQGAETTPGAAFARGNAYERDFLGTGVHPRGCQFEHGIFISWLP